MSLADVAGGVNDAIQQQMLLRYQQMRQEREWQQSQRAYNDTQTHQKFEDQRQTTQDALAARRLDQQDRNDQALRSAQMANYQSEADKRTEDAGAKAADTIPGGSMLMPTDPGVSTLQKGGYGALLTPRMTLPSTQMSGAASLGTDEQATPSTGFLRTTTRTEAKPEAYIKAQSFDQNKASATEAEKAAALARAAANDAATQDYHTKELGIQQQNANTAASKAANPSEPLVKVTTYDPQTGESTEEYMPRSQAAGHKSVKPPSPQEAQSAASKKEALGSLDQLDQAIEDAKDKIGPGMGRVSSIQQMVGNSDPRISALGTKMLLTKMQVDHAASGTVRAGASPQILSRWDNILGNNQTPEGLKAAVQAMREILGGGAATGAAPRKRFNPTTGKVE